MKHAGLSVLILHNIPREPSQDGVTPDYAESDLGVLEEVHAVAAGLTRLDVTHRVAGVRYLADVPWVIGEGSENVVVNLVEGFHEKAWQANFVPAICQSLGRGCTGNDTPSLLLTLDKSRTKAVLKSAGLPTPPGTIVPVGGRARRSGLPPGPYIVKPCHCDASEGIDEGSVVKVFGSKLHNAVRRVHERFAQPAMVEQLVGHRELNLSILQRGDKLLVMPPAEIDFADFESDRPRIVDYAAKWLPDSFAYLHTPRIIPAPISKRVIERIQRDALAAWIAVGCNDYARVDLRLDEKDNPYILEINANPDISPEGGYAAALSAGQIAYDEFLAILLENAAQRMGIGEPLRLSRGVKRRRKPGKSAAQSLTIRYSEWADRDTVVDLLRRTNFFRPDELDIAQEVLDDSLAKGHDGHYQSFIAEHDGQVCGWVCFGPTPCTVSTYDLYWIAVDPQRQSLGIGQALMDHAEKLIAQRNGRLVVVETSGQPRYLPTRRFYLKLGYLEASRLTDFYSPGDDKITYIKVLTT